MSNPEAVRQDCRDVLAKQVTLLSPLKGQMLVMTGGTGFLGTWVAELVASLNDDHNFGIQLVLIARQTEKFAELRPHLANRRDFRLTKCDVRNLGELPKETDWLIHAAAKPDNRLHASNPLETMAVIAEGTSAVLRAADRCGNLKLLLNLSSGLIYGALSPDVKNIAENYPGAPAAGSSSSAYAEAKRYAETLVAAARTQARIPCATARPFAFVGPYQGLDTPWAVNNFFHDALNGHPIRVFGDGQAVRSYLYGSDAAFWLLRMLTAAQSGDVFNLGSPEGVTLEKLARQIGELSAAKSQVLLRSQSSAHASTCFVPDTNAVEKKLGLQVTVPLREALNKTLRWHQK